MATVRRIDLEDHDDIGVVAERMHETLVEVLGEERGAAMYSPGWLVDRVRQHLDPARLDGAVWVADSDDDDELVGHVMAREERDDDEDDPFGLIATVYVTPEARRDGVATVLIEAAEAWMRRRGLTRAATATSRDNRKLIALFEGRGYAIALHDDAMQMVRLERAL